MKKLQKKLILEFLNVENKKEALSEAEKTNFIVSILGNISKSALELFETLSSYTDIPDTEISEENKDLLESIREDVSIIIGKANQGIKDNSAENIQNMIDDGQTVAQETLIDKE